MLEIFVTVSLFAALLAGFASAIKGPAVGDRLAGLLYSGTSGVGLLVWTSVQQSSTGLLDAALVLVVLAPILTVAFLASTKSSDREPL